MMDMPLSPLFFDIKHTLVIVIKEVDGKESLFKQLYRGLAREEEEEANWDALSDILQDMSHIREKHIVIIHDNLDALSQRDLHIYLSLIQEALIWWSSHEEHDLLVVLNPRLKNVFEEWCRQ